MSFMIPFPEISPDLFSFELFGITIALRWYALAYIAGIVIAWRLTLAALRRPDFWRDKPPFTAAQIEDLLTWIILGVILGGRLGFVLFYNPQHFLENPSEIPQVWQGGMSFHGGFLGVVFATWLFARKHNVPTLAAADAIAIGVPWGLFLGRIANFINAELWGRPTDLPWGVAFPGQAAQYCPDVVGLCARHPSQLYEAALEGLILGIVILWLVWRRGALQQSGLVSGVFFAGYGAARFVVEFFRQPDAQFITDGNPLGLALHVNGYGLTMGQILSLPMILIGLFLVMRARRSAAFRASAP